MKFPGKIKGNFSVGFIILIALLILGGGFFFILKNSLTIERTHPALSKEGLWNLAALSQAPKIEWINQNEKIKSFYYEGLPYKGEKTLIFAYYATPGSISGDPTKDHDLPAVVVVHGGMGGASSRFVNMWAERGYAAISMELDGLGPDAMRMSKNGGPPSYEYMSYDWSIHAVAKIILAHSLILSFKEIDPKKTGLSGVSLGGHLTCIAAAVDKRFKAAASVYGCGFLYKDGFFKDWYDSKLSKKEKEIWREILDPSNYIGSITVPFLFAATTKDIYYPLNNLYQSYQLLRGPCFLYIDPEFEHSEDGAALHLLKPFFDRYLLSKDPLPLIQQPEIIENKIDSKVSDLLRPNLVWLTYTTDIGTYDKRKWQIVTAKLENNKIISDLPSDKITACFFNYLVDEHAVISSKLLLTR